MQTLAIIRPKKQLMDSIKLVESFGYRAAGTTLIDIVPIRDPQWPSFLDELGSGIIDYIVITSANGASSCATLGLNAALVPSASRVVAIGPKTRSALLKNHLRVDLMPHEYSSRGVVEMLNSVADKNIWVLRSAYGTPELVHGLQSNGATVNEVILYTLKKCCGLPQRDFVRAIVSGDTNAVLFTSAQTVHAFFDCADKIGIRERLFEPLANALIGAIGKPTADALARYNICVDVTPEYATFKELVSAVDVRLKNSAPQ